MGGGMGAGQGTQMRDLTPGSYFRVWVVDGKQIKPLRVLLACPTELILKSMVISKKATKLPAGTLTQTASATQNNPFQGGGQRRF